MIRNPVFEIMKAQIQNPNLKRNDDVPVNPKKKPSWQEFAGRLFAGGTIAGAATIYAAWSNQLKLNPDLKAPFPTVFRRAIASQAAMKTGQFTLFISAQRALAEQFPDNKRTVTAVAYCGAATVTQGSIYTMATRVILRAAGRVTSSLSGLDLLKGIRVAFKPTLAREFGSTSAAIALTEDVENFLGAIFPKDVTKVLGAPTAGLICGLGTQFVHNVALTESKHASEGKPPSTVAAAREVIKNNGWHSLYRGFFPARAVLIMLGAVVGSKVLGPLKRE